MTSLHVNIFPRLLLSLLSIGWSFIAAGQNPQPSFFHYTSADGLPSSECYEIIQDRKGYIWISTDNGVSRFDGYEFKNYGTEEGLLDKTVLVMKEDHRGWIWLSTFSGNFYIVQGDTIVPYAHNDVLQQIRSKYYLIENFEIDEQGEMLVVMKGYNIGRIDKKGKLSVFFNTTIEEQGYHSIYYAEASNTPYYLSRELNDSEEGKTYFTQKYWDNNLLFFLVYHGLNPTPLSYHFPVDHSDRPQQGAGSRTNVQALTAGPLIQNFDSLFHIPVQGAPEFLTGRSPDFINCVFNDSDGSIMVGYNLLAGLKHYASVDRLLAHQPSAVLLEGYTITHVLKDRWGGLWVATLEDGIFYAPVPENFTNTVDANQEGGILSEIVISKNEGIIVAQSSGKVYTVKEDLSLQEHSFIENVNSLNDLVAFDSLPIFSTSPLKYWDNGVWTEYQRYYEVNRMMRGIGLKKIEPSQQSNQFWGIHAMRGLFKFSYQNQKINIEENFPLPGSNKMTALSEDLQGNVWLGGLDGLFKLAGDNTPPIAQEGHPIYRERIEDIQLLPGGGIAVATRGSGIYLQRADSLIIWSVADGLSSNTISHLHIADGILWATGNKGLNRIPLEEGITANYIFTRKDGLPNEHINDLAILGDYIYLISQNNITRISQQPPTVIAPSPLYIDKIFVNGKAYPPTQLQQLDWQENNIQLDYHLLDYSQDGNIQYRFRLNPQNEWFTTVNNSMDLLNLNPGNYQLDIEAKGKVGNWIAAAPIVINISPPFWQTIWFFLICTLGALGIAYSFFTRRLQTLAQAQERTNLQEQVTQLKQQAYRAQMNPHFIFNCMSTIQGMIIGDQGEQDKAIRMVTSFSQLIRSALEFAEEETVLLKEELKLLHNYLALEQLRFNHSFTYEINVPPTIEADWVRVPPMLIQPFAENAVLHGMRTKRGDGKIILSYELIDNTLRVIIEDNGPGISVTKAEKAKFASKYQHKSLGMTITQRRLSILNNNQFELKVEEPRDANGKITGTKLTVYIPLSQ